MYINKPISSIQCNLYLDRVLSTWTRIQVHHSITRGAFRFLCYCGHPNRSSCI